MDPTSTRELGRTGLELTILGLGSAPLGGFRGPIPEDDALDTVQAAYDAGVKYFDTSPYYGYGRSEHRFGQVLRQIDRENFIPFDKGWPGAQPTAARCAKARGLP